MVKVSSCWMGDRDRDTGGYQNDQCTEEVNRRITSIITPQNYQQAKLAATLLSLPPLGLKLSITPTLIESMENKLNSVNSEAFARQELQPMSEKLKASNFTALSIKIGSWERISVNEGDLVVKCYYAKRKLVWEFLERRLKSKIEIQWSDIIGIRAVTNEYQPGTLEIELNKIPTFHQEVNPQPRKHTIWKEASDFTQGEASKCRRHLLKFSPGTLDKHYDKLINYDNQLLSLSRKPFPTLQSHYFQSDPYGIIPDFSTSIYDGFGPLIDPRFGFNLPSYPFSLNSNLPPPAAPYYRQAPLPSFMKVPPPILSDEDRTMNKMANHTMALWDQGMNNYQANSYLAGEEQYYGPTQPTMSHNVVATYHQVGRDRQNGQQVFGNRQIGAGNFGSNHLLNIENQNGLISDSEFGCFYMASEENPGILSCSNNSRFVDGVDRIIIADDENSDVSGASPNEPGIIDAGGQTQIYEMVSPPDHQDSGAFASRGQDFPPSDTNRWWAHFDESNCWDS